MKSFQSLESFIGISGTKKQSQIGWLLFVASAILTLASGYTTYNGLTEYVPNLIAIFITLGIQSLLFVSSWKIGSDRLIGEYSSVTWVIFVITLATSVFFSYSSLLDLIFTTEDRIENELRYAQKESILIVDDLRQLVINEANTDSLYSEITKEAIGWYDAFSIPVINKLEKFRTSNNENSRKVERLKKTAEQQLISLKYNYDSIVESNYKQTLNSIGYLEGKYLVTTDTKILLADSLSREVDNSFKEFLMNENNIDYIDLGRLNANSNKLSSLLELEPQPIPEDLVKMAETFQRAHTFIEYCNSFDPLEKETISQIRGDLIELTLKLDFLEKEISKVLVNQAFEFGDKNGENVHYFVVSITQLSRKNPLAIGAISIALVIDLMVFFCGILGARPDSLLHLKNKRQLDKVIDSALMNSLSIDTETALPMDTPLRIRRIVSILKNIIPDLKYVDEEGKPSAYIDENVINDLKLASELSVFVASGLAMKEKNGSKIYLKTVLILWFASEVNQFFKSRNL